MKDNKLTHQPMTGLCLQQVSAAPWWPKWLVAAVFGISLIQQSQNLEIHNWKSDILLQPIQTSTHNSDQTPQ